MEDIQTPEQEQVQQPNPHHYDIDVLKSVGLDHTFNDRMDNFTKALEDNPPKSYKDEYDQMLEHFTKEDIAMIAVQMHNAVSVLNEQARIMSEVMQAEQSKQKNSGLYLPGIH